MDRVHQAERFSTKARVMNHEKRHFRKSSRISGNALLAIGCLETKVNLTSQSWSLAMKSHATKRFARTASVDLRCWEEMKIQPYFSKSFDSMNPAQILACHLFVSGILCIDIFEGLLEI